MSEVYDSFGVNALDIWDLPADDFFGMADAIDRMRREAKQKPG